jgi:hypothetical protein
MMNESRFVAGKAGLGDAGWNAFWFAPAPTGPIAMIRGLLCVLAAAYFASSWSDVRFWYVDGGPLSAQRVANFLQTGGVEDSARWIVSPLFWVESAWVYRAFLLGGVAVSLLVAAGRGGRVAAWGLWLLLVGWANRTMIVSGLAETLLSLGLFAAAIAPPGAAWAFWTAAAGTNPDGAKEDWTAGFSQRLIAVQITLIGAATFVTMLAGRIWFNGLGAYALAAPAQDRTIDWTSAAGWLSRVWIHESLTHLMVLALPLGLLLAWLPACNRLGQAVVIGWCLAVSLLGSHWLYGGVFAVMVCAIAPSRRS